MKIKDILIFLAGAGLGVLGSAFYFKKKYDQRMEEEIAAIMKIHNNAPQPVTVSSDDLDIEVYKKATTEYAKSDEPVTSPAVDIRPTKVKVTTDYTKFTRTNQDEEDENNEIQGEILTKEAAENRGKPPIVIDPNDMQSIPGYDAVDLYYYEGNHVLTLADDYGEEEIKTLDEVRDLLGDILDTTGFATSTYKRGECICIRNFRMSTDYCVTKIAGNYEA